MSERTTDDILLDELRGQLKDFKTVLTADFVRRLSEHDANCTRQILQRTSRGPLGVDGGAPGDPRAGQRALLADNEQFRNWITQPRSSRSSFVCEVAMPPAHERKAITNIGGTTHVAGVAGPPMPALRLADLIQHIPVTLGGSVEWTKETAFTPAAGEVPEGTLKPSSTLTFQNQNSPFITTATITKASVQSLADVPQLQSWIDRRLQYAVMLKQEGSLLNDPAGLLASAQPLDAAYDPGATATTLDVIGAAVGQLAAAGFTPDGIVLSGADVNKARLLKTTTGEYLWADPDSLVGTIQMWGTPLVISPSLASGKFLVGAFAESAIIFDRQVLVVEISYENEDDFVKNLATLRAELRAALAIPVPSGLITGTLPAGALTSQAHTHPSGIPQRK